VNHTGSRNSEDDPMVSRIYSYVSGQRFLQHEWHDSRF
jgi:hypothetical protein